jgi:hypothetical protein
LGVRPARIEIEIDELVLDGFPAVDRAVVVAEIQRAVSARLWPDRVDGGSLEARTDSLPRTIGAAVAERLHEGLFA